MTKNLDILILSNGPGELATWVRPAVKELTKLSGDNYHLRISVVLSPCPYSTGLEGAIARSIPGVDRVQTVQDFFPFLLFGKTVDNWDWYPQGIVLFLGGDQFFTLLIGKHLGYQTLIYAEWEARWYRFINKFAAMNQEVIDKVPIKYQDKCRIIGDLMGDIASDLPANFTRDENEEIIGLLPGSRPTKLAVGLPISLAIAEKIYAQRPQTRFIIPVAASVKLEDLPQFVTPNQNPITQKFGNIGAELHLGDQPFLLTNGGLKVELWTQQPAYNLLLQCSLCLTTLGANTAELGSLNIPMIVLIPTQQLDMIKAWDGVLGLLTNLPVFGKMFSQIVNWSFLRFLDLQKDRLFAWPNIWAKREIVPELRGHITPEQVAKLAIDLLSNPAKLQAIRDDLRVVRGTKGASVKLAQIVAEMISYSNA